MEEEESGYVITPRNDVEVSSPNPQNPHLHRFFPHQSGASVSTSLRSKVVAAAAVARLPPLNPKDPFLLKFAYIASANPDLVSMPPSNSEIPPFWDLFDSPKLMASPAQRAFGGKSIGYNNYMVYARALSITWGNDPRYWRWLSLEEDIDVEVAELRDVCWLEVKGKIDMKRLEPGVKYDVLFVILMINPSGFEPKATFSLQLPSGVTQEKKFNLAAIKPKQWVKVRIGEFVATEENGDVIFSLTNYEKLNWKKGLIIEGVLIQQRA